MSKPLKNYRIYCFDIALKAVTADFIKAAGDDEAIAEAKAQGFGSKCEIWDGRRLVGQFEDERRSA